MATEMKWLVWMYFIKPIILLLIIARHDCIIVAHISDNVIKIHPMSMFCGGVCVGCGWGCVCVLFVFIWFSLDVWFVCLVCLVLVVVVVVF